MKTSFDGATQPAEALRYVAGTASDVSCGDHNAYTAKIRADGTSILWGITFDGPNNLTRTTTATARPC